MNSTSDYGQLRSPRWLSPTLFTVALVTFLATVVSFVILMGNRQSHVSGTWSTDLDTDAIDALKSPPESRLLARNPACFTSPISRCYLMELSEREALDAAIITLGMGEPRVTHGGDRRGYEWCSTLNGAPAAAVLRPHISNARPDGHDSWTFPQPVEYDGHWVLGVFLLEQSCA